MKKKTTPPAQQLDPERELAYDIAQAIHDLRTQQGLSQGELAERSSTRQPAISRLEAANTLPTLALLLRLSSALGVQLNVSFEKPEGTDTA